MRIDAAILGVPRTGTTLLANLMTDPEARRWCAVEPGSYSYRRHDQLRARAELLGWKIASPSPEDVAALVDTLDRFGVKEVRSGPMGAALAAGPSRVIACVRDVRDVAVSLGDKRFVHQRTGPKPEGLQRVTERYLGLLDTVQVPVTVVRYEDLVGSPGYRDRLGREIDWPLTGDPSRNLDLYRRGDEVRKGIRSRRTPADRRAAEERLGPLQAFHEACLSYQRRFGYA